VLEFGFENVCIATGSSWRADGVSRQHVVPIVNDKSINLYTPDDIMNDNLPTGKVVIYDDDHYYMGGVIAERLIEKGCDVTLLTPCAYVSEWSINTLEQAEIQKRLIEMGVEIELNRGLVSISNSKLISNCIYTQNEKEIETDNLVMVASRQPQDQLHKDLLLKQTEWIDAGIKSVKLIGDANAPGPIAWATYAGHRYARELDTEEIGDACH
jgi:Uncharacterized NAD(FAD)-dependent dehydrogenases